MQFRNSQHRCRQPQTGMSMIELLIVIGVIGLLMAVAMPSLRIVKMNSRKSVEMNAARQLMAAYIAYANNNRDSVLTGFGPSSATAFDAKNNPIGGNAMTNLAKQRYPWRIAPYLDYRMDGLFLHGQNELLEAAKHSTYDSYLYAASIVPSFGINARWVGGDFATGASPKACLPTEIDCDSHNDCCLYDMMFGRYWITRVSEPRTPDRLIVFASARSQTEPVPGWGTHIVEGYHEVKSPYFTKAGSDWSSMFTPSESPSKFGFVSPRYADQAVIGFMDGRVGLLSKDDLYDMRYWADRADHEQWYMKAK